MIIHRTIRATNPIKTNSSANIPLRSDRDVIFRDAGSQTATPLRTPVRAWSCRQRPGDNEADSTRALINRLFPRELDLYYPGSIYVRSNRFCE
jgi:hypothetical protein